jgi:outer membrane protein assembly factor BamB
MKRHLTALALAVGLLAQGPLRGEDWPEFRGPTGQGLAAGAALPVHWGPDTHVVWKQRIPGSGWSSPVVAGNRIYLTTSVPVPDSADGDQSLRALCLDARTGTTRWEREVFRLSGARAPRIHGKNSHASPTPLIHGGRLYVHFGHEGTACLDLDGKILWRNNRVKYEPVHGNGGSPVLVDDALVFSTDGAADPAVVALDRKNGQLRWKTDRSVDFYKKFSFSTPLVITVNGTRQIISVGSGMFGAYDPRTGREIWKVEHDGYSVVPRPVFGQGLIFVSTGYDSPRLLAIRPDGKGDVTKTHVAWSTRKGAPHNPSPLLVGTELYLISDQGVASCLDARTGRVHWQQRVGGSYSASPIYAAGRIYLQSEDGTGIVLRAGKEFKQLAKNTLRERSLASCAAANGALFIRTAGHLYRIEDK